jgi:hypothetical protein
MRLGCVAPPLPARRCARFRHARCFSSGAQLGGFAPALALAGLRCAPPSALCLIGTSTACWCGPAFDGVSWPRCSAISTNGTVTTSLRRRLARLGAGGSGDPAKLRGASAEPVTPGSLQAAARRQTGRTYKRQNAGPSRRRPPLAQGGEPLSGENRGRPTGIFPFLKGFGVKNVLGSSAPYPSIGGGPLCDIG